MPLQVSLRPPRPSPVERTALSVTSAGPPGPNRSAPSEMVGAHTIERLRLYGSLMEATLRALPSVAAFSDALAVAPEVPTEAISSNTTPIATS